MRQFEEQTKKVKEVTSIVCNKCVDKRWGSFSDKDNRMDHFDLCEACYDELTGSFKIKLEEE